MPFIMSKVGTRFDCVIDVICILIYKREYFIYYESFTSIRDRQDLTCITQLVIYQDRRFI